jgi:hypothetical protein
MIVTTGHGRSIPVVLKIGQTSFVAGGHKGRLYAST